MFESRFTKDQLQKRLSLRRLKVISGFSTDRLRQRALVVGSHLNLIYFWDKKWFYVAMLVGALMMQLPLPDGLSHEGLIVLTMSVVATILFVTEPVPLPTVALMIICAQVLNEARRCPSVKASAIADGQAAFGDGRSWSPLGAGCSALVRDFIRMTMRHATHDVSFRSKPGWPR